MPPSRWPAWTTGLMRSIATQALPIKYFLEKKNVKLSIRDPTDLVTLINRYTRPTAILELCVYFSLGSPLLSR